jgi:pyrroline-5-carboxylate reductase
MGKNGFIGYGAMGSIMLKALLDNKAIVQQDVIVITRTPAKLVDFRKKYPKVEIAANLPELAAKCSRVFICTGTKEVKPVLAELVKYLPEGAHIITITGAIEMDCLESLFPGKVTKIIPTQIAEVGAGVTLVCHNNKVLPSDRAFITSAFGKIGKVKEIEEKQFDLAIDLTSCSPAFYAAILRGFSKAAALHGNLTPDELKELIIATCYGTARLLTEKGVSFDDLVTRVATRGGISEEGVKIIDSALPGIFDEILRVTLGKREKIKHQIREQYGLE